MSKDGRTLLGEAIEYISKQYGYMMLAECLAECLTAVVASAAPQQSPLQIKIDTEFVVGEVLIAFEEAEPEGHPENGLDEKAVTLLNDAIEQMILDSDLQEMAEILAVCLCRAIDKTDNDKPIPFMIDTVAIAGQVWVNLARYAMVDEQSMPCVS